MQIVTTFLIERLHNTSKADSYLNALIMLDMFTRTIPYVIDESLEEIRYLFTPYLKSPN